MNKNKPIILVDPYPRTMDLLFSKENLNYLKKNFKLITAPNKNKNNFYEKNLPGADYIFGQPNLPSSLISKSTKLKAIFNVESNFMDNMDYDYCFRNGIHVLATSPVFAQPVAEMAMGLTLSIARSIHIAHSDFILKKEKYGGAISQNNFLLKNKKFGLIGFGDLAKSLTPILKAFSNSIIAYDPWIPNKEIEKFDVKPTSLNSLLKNADIIYVLASITSSNESMINSSKLKLIKDGSVFVLMSRAAIINFDDFFNFLKIGMCLLPLMFFHKNHFLKIIN